MAVREEHEESTINEDLQQAFIKRIEFMMLSYTTVKCIIELQ